MFINKFGHFNTFSLCSTFSSILHAYLITGQILKCENALHLTNTHSIKFIYDSVIHKESTPKQIHNPLGQARFQFLCPDMTFHNNSSNHALKTIQEF